MFKDINITSQAKEVTGKVSHSYKTENSGHNIWKVSEWMRKANSYL